MIQYKMSRLRRFFEMSRFQARSYALVVALAIFGTNRCPAAESFPAATPESQGVSAAAVRRVADEVEEYLKNGTTDHQEPQDDPARGLRRSRSRRQTTDGARHDLQHSLDDQTVDGR
jgi:hypothetical protein